MQRDLVERAKAGDLDAFSELARISTSEVCYVAVTYRSELGMKMTSQVENPGCF